MLSLYAEGVFIDMWTVTHFLFGVILFFVFTSRRINIYLQILFALILAVFWEIFELSFKIIEYFSNRVVDVAVTILGLIIFFYWHSKKGIAEDHSFKYLIVVLYLLLCGIGWAAYTFL
jgi:hypothetical protein